MKKILVTGGCGFLGSHFLRAVLNKYPDALVVNLDRLSYYGNPENISDIVSHRLIFKEGDVCDRATVDSLFSYYHIDTVVHLAEESSEIRASVEPEIYLRTNVLGTFNLLEAARRYWLVEKRQGNIPVKFHHVSTWQVYGTLAPLAPAFSEVSRYDPESPYAASKAGADHLASSYAKSKGLPITISVPSNVFGPYQYPDKLVARAISASIDGKPIEIYGDGNQSRDWLYVGDACQAILSIVEKGKPGETYNVGGDNERSNLEVAQAVRGAVSHARKKFLPNPEHVSELKDNIPRSALNFSKLYNHTGWLPAYSLSEGIRETVDWYLAHPHWLENVQKKKDYATWLSRQYAKVD